MRINPAYLSVLIVGSCLLYSASTFAQRNRCNLNTGQSNNYAKYEPSLTEIKSWTGWRPQITVPSSAQVGEVLATFTHRGTPNLDPNGNQFANAAYVAYANCPPGRVETFRMLGNPSTMGGVYRLRNSDNIGYRVYYPNYPTAPMLRFTSGGQGTIPRPGSSEQQYMLVPPPGDAKIEFILLSHNWPTSRSVTISGLVAESDMDGSTSPKLYRYNVDWPITFIPEPCRFTTGKVLSLSLDPVDAEQFTAVGQARNTKNLPPIQMECSGVSAQPKVQVKGAADNSGTPGVLKNQSTSSAATGVGILLEHNPPSISPYAADLSGGTNEPSLGLVNIGSCGSGCTKWDLPMRASYYSTAPTVTAGAVSARVTIDVTYP